MKAQFVATEEAMRSLGETYGRQLRGGEILALSGDVGAGKTTFIKGLASGLGVTGVVQSPSFTISRRYDGLENELTFVHYDFYRLTDAGIMRMELSENINDARCVIALEWSEAVRDVVPEDRVVRVAIAYGKEGGRYVEVSHASRPDDLTQPQEGRQ